MVEPSGSLNFLCPDVLKSRVIAYPFHLLECCLVTDGGGALVLVAAERAGDFPAKPVYVLGTGESSETPMISQMEDFTTSRAFRVSGRVAFAEARITPDDVDHLMICDAFAHLPIYGLEDLGFVKRGGAGRFHRDEDRRLAEGVGAGAERRCHQRVRVELAAEAELLAGLPRVPDRANRLDELAHARGGPRPRHAEALRAAPPGRWDPAHTGFLASQ